MSEIPTGTNLINHLKKGNPLEIKKLHGPESDAQSFIPAARIKRKSEEDRRIKKYLKNLPPP